MVHLGARVGLTVCQGKCARDKGTRTGGDEHGRRHKRGPAQCRDAEPAIVLALQALHQLAQVEAGLHRCNLGLETLDQLAPGAHGQRRNVVNRFVGVEFGALAAHIGQGVDEVGFDPLKAQLKHLEQTHRPGADDQGVGSGGCQGRGPAVLLCRRRISGSARRACRFCLSSHPHRAAALCVW